MNTRESATRREPVQRDPIVEMAYWRTVYQLRDEGWTFEDALTETAEALERVLPEYPRGMSTPEKTEPDLPKVIPVGQRVRLLETTKAKLLWDRSTYSASVEAGSEGVISGEVLFDRDGYLTTEAVQEIRGYPGTPGFEVSCIVLRQGYLSNDLVEAWAYVTPDALAVVEPGRSLPHDAKVEQLLRKVELEES